MAGTTLKLSHFNVKMLTMHRWFSISAAEKDLDYAPIISYADGWKDCLLWFKECWLPTFQQDGRFFGIADQSREKIDIQASGTAVKDKAA